MSTREAEPRARTIASIAEIAEVDATAIRGEQRLREDLGMDSLSSLELLSTISERLRIDLDIEDAMEIRTVDDACAFVEREFAEQTGDGRGAS